MRSFISILLICLFGILSAPMAGAGHDMAGTSMEMPQGACPDCDAGPDGEHGVCSHAAFCSLYFVTPPIDRDQGLSLKGQAIEAPEPWSAASVPPMTDHHPPRSFAEHS